MPLTPVATRQGDVAAANILEPGSAVFDPAATATVVFSDPPMASAGLTEAAARKLGLDVDVRSFDMSDWYTSRRVGLTTAGAKVIIDRASDTLVGAHLLGHAADETINALLVAIHAGVHTRDLDHMLWSYPTAGWDIRYLIA